MDIGTFVPVSSSIFTRSFAVVLGLICTFRTKVRSSLVDRTRLLPERYDGCVFPLFLYSYYCLYRWTWCLQAFGNWFFKIATLCLDDSFVHSWHSLNQLHLECFSNCLEGVPTYAELLLAAFPSLWGPTHPKHTGLRLGDCGGQVIWFSTPLLSFLVKWS